MNKPYNESAFPTPGPSNDEDLERRFPGMTLLDYFAAHAMQAVALAVLTTQGAAEACAESHMKPNDFVADKAYAFAESMLIRRAKT